MNMVKEYKCFEIEIDIKDTEELLNSFAKEGWRLVCSYAKCNYYLIMERDKKICPECKR